MIIKFQWRKQSAVIPAAKIQNQQELLSTKFKFDALVPLSEKSGFYFNLVTINVIQ